MVAYAFYPKAGGKMGAVVLPTRVGRDDVCFLSKMEERLFPYQIYMEARNLHQCKKLGGKICCFRKNDQDDWRFGIVVDLIPAVDAIAYVLMWDGPLLPQERYRPEYLFMQKDAFLSGGWKDHFKERVVWNMAEFKYLNLVYGREPFTGRRIDMTGLDGKLGTSVFQPDSMPCPGRDQLTLPHMPRQLRKAFLLDTPDYKNRSECEKFKRKRSSNAVKK
jgi:hypothetical protein